MYSNFGNALSRSTFRTTLISTSLWRMDHLSNFFGQQQWSRSRLAEKEAFRMLPVQSNDGCLPVVPKCPYSSNSQTPDEEL